MTSVALHPRSFALMLGTALLVLAFMPVAGGDPLKGGSVLNQVYELGCLSIGFALIAGTTPARLLRPLMILTDARAPTAGLALALLLMGVFMPIRRDVKLVGFAAVFLLLIAALSVSGDLGGLVGENTKNEAVTLNGRTELWNHVIRLIWDGPVTGRGYYSSRFVLIGAFDWAGQAHNSFLEVALGTGAPGVLLFSLFWIYWAVNLFRAPSPLC